MKNYLKAVRAKLLAATVASLCSLGICSGQNVGGTVVAWDDNFNLQTNVPAGLSNVVSLAANSYYTIAVKSDGTITVWGQFYDDAITLPAGLNNISAAAAGPNHSLVLKSDGTVMAWGDSYNSFGVQNVPAGLGNVVQVKATVYDSFALKSDGTITVWGTDAFGSAEIPAGLSNVVAIAARDYSGLALKCDGTVIPWGLFLQTSLPPGLTNIVAIEETANNSLALKSDGTVISWANDVPAGLSNVTGIAVGGDSIANHNLALKSDGTVVSWGSNVTVPAGVSNVVGIAANYSTCAAVVGSGSPLIFRQPFINQTVYSGTTIFLNVGATGWPPVTYQWRHSITNVSDATNSTLVLKTVGLSDSGTYSVTVSNSQGVLASRNATLTVIDAPPTVTSQPLSQTVAVGINAALTVKATGSQPFNYQWRFNGTDIDWATNATLTLTNVQLTNAGSYDVLVGNAFGFTNSSSAVLTVVDFAAALNTTNLTWGTSGDLPWFVTTSSSHDGVSSAQAGDVVSNRASILQTTVTGPATVTFWWYLTVNNGPYPTSLSLAANGFVQSQLTGTAGWRQQTCYLGAGTQSLAWTFTTTYPNTGVNIAGLDQVTFTPGGTAPIISASTGNQTKPAGTNVTFTVTAIGTPPLYYQWFFNCNSIIGGTNSSLVLTDVQTNAAGIYDVQISNDFGMTNSSNAALFVNSSAPFILKQPTNEWVLPQGNANLIVTARGSSPLSYQWTFNGTNLPDATNSLITIYNAQPLDAGLYGVAITNANGSRVSSNAVLTISTVVAWNVNNYGQAKVPYNLGVATAIAGSQYDSLAVRKDGSVLVWGHNDLGETNVPVGLSNVINVAASQQLSLALKNDETLSWWGWSSYTNIIPGLSNITAVAASQGNFYSALQRNGTVISWGANGYGQTNVPSGLSNVVAIAEGDYHCLALKSDGTLAAWGGNVKGTYGQATVPTGLSNIVAIAAGDYYSLAVKSDGTVVGFPTNNINVVMRIPSGLSNVVSVAAGSQHALALTRDGLVWEWGTVGTGFMTNQMGFLNAVAIACGYYHSLANIGDGSPAIIRQPWNQTFYAGYSTMMNAGVVGAPPLSYQWQLNGINIDGATNALLKLANVQPTNAGSYSLGVSNSFGTAVSSNATLTVITIPPSLTLQPTNQTAIAGSNVTFAVVAGPGPVPITYQWQFNKTNIDWATNLLLTLTNVQLANQGSYDAVVSNGFGSVTSSNALLTVIVLDLATALDAPGFVWTNSGSAAWFPETTVTHDGVEAAQSGSVANGQQSVLQTTVTGPGTLTFWWMFAPLTFPYPNSLSFSTSQSNNAASVSSTTGWEQRTFYLGAGMQTLSWTYSRYPIFTGPSTGRVDQVSFVPGGTAPIITSAPPTRFVRANANTSFSIGVNGTPPLAYQWQFNATNLVNQTNATLTLLNVQPTNSGVYNVVITNDYGTIATNTLLFVQLFAINASPTNLLMTTNGFQLQINGILSANPMVILGSTDLVSWLPVYTNPPTTGSVQFLDVMATNLPARFYRAQE